MVAVLYQTLRLHREGVASQTITDTCSFKSTTERCVLSGKRTYESDIATFTAEELRQFLISKGVCQEVAVEFESNMVSGDSFLQLTDEDLKELVKPIGVRPQIREILRQQKEVG